MAPRRPDERDTKRWETLRQRSAATYTRLVERGPNPDKDVMGAIAWRSGWPETKPYDETLRQLIERARVERYTWREIGAAEGHDDDGSISQHRQLSRNRQAPKSD
jgi:hypothetical protein